MPLPLCALPYSNSVPPTVWSQPLHPSSSSLLSPSHDIIIKSTHYCDDDEVVLSADGDAHREKERKGKAYPCKMLSPKGMGKENKCPQSLGGKDLKCSKKSKLTLTDSKRSILGARAVLAAEVESVEPCTVTSSGPNFEITPTALVVSQECSSRSSELAFEELEQWYLKWKSVLHSME